jgi:hypothetical protein
MRPSTPRPRASPVLLIVLAVALAVGASASLVAGAAAPSAFHPGPSSEILLAPNSLGVIFLVVLATVVGIFLYIRLSSNTLAVPSRFVVTALTAILVGVLLIALFHVLGGGGAGSLVRSSGGGNSTGGGQSGGNTTGNATGPGGQLDILSFHLPSWSFFAAVALAVVLVAAIAVPAAWAASVRRERRNDSRRKDAGKVARVRGALALAAQELDVGEEPRAVVIRLYTALLRRVGPIVGGVERVTPEEIRSLHLERLGIRSSAATTMTRLFEEARYSSHSMGPEVARRASAAISEALADLDRSRSEAP